MNAREGSWTGDLLIVDTEDLKTMPPSEIHVKKLQIKGGGTFSREATNLFSHAGRAKYCKNGCRSPSLCTKRRATSGENLNTILHKKKEEPEIQIYLLKLDKISVLLWNITYVSESHWSENETPCSSRRFSDTSESHWCPETWKRAVMHCKKWPSMTIGTWMPISHCLNPGPVWQGSSLFNKNPPEGHVWVQVRLTKETGQRKTWTYWVGRMVKHVENISAQSDRWMGRRKTKHWMQHKSNETFTVFWTMIQIGNQKEC